MKCRNSVLLLISLMFISCGVWSQSPAARRAERNMKAFDFAKAAENYKAASDKAPKDIALKEKLARAYVLAEDHGNAETVYAQLVKTPTSQAVNKLYYGIELRANGKYAEAAKAFNEYALLVPEDSRAKELKDGADKMKSLAMDNKICTITNVAELNSPFSEMGAGFYKDGLIFSTNRGKGVSIVREDAWTGHSFYDLYTSHVVADKFIAPVKVKGKQPDRKFHEGPAIVSADGKELFFTRSNYKKYIVKRSKNNNVMLKIMHADWDEKKQQWVNVQELPINSNDYSVSHPALSKDGKRLFFVSDMPGGMGETDIYVSYRDINNNWGPAINLGEGVNTKGRELFPYIADDGTFYFASDSRLGLGGLDIYAATFANGQWGNALNLGAPINTSADDFGYIIDAENKNGYFISNRAGGLGDDDIYRFTRTGIALCGTVVDEITKAPLTDAVVKLADATSVIATKTVGDKGDFCFPVQPKTYYKLTVAKKDYEPYSMSLSSGNTNQVVQLPMRKQGGIDLIVCVTQSGKGVVEGAVVELTNKATGEKQTCTITTDCKCKFNVDANTNYTICASKQASSYKGSYDHPCKEISTKGKVAPASMYETLEMTYLEEDMVIKIDNLYYDLSKWNIREDAALELDKLVVIMKKFPNMEIELSSHTDCRGSMQSNDELSQKRAKSCVDYLVAHGIEASRMTAMGYGERKLVNTCACEGNVKSNCTEEQHQQNRRTEFKIVKLK